MCRSAAEGGRRCNGRSCGAAGARARQARCRARRGLEAAHAAGDPAVIAAAEAKYTAVTGTPPPPPDAGTFAGQLPTTPEPTGPEKPMPKPEEPKPSKPEPTSTPAGSTADRVRDAVAKLVRDPESQAGAGIVDVRKALGDVDHDELTRVLVDMARNDPNVHLLPEDNRKALKQEDHDAAVDYSGEPQHIIRIEHPRDTSAKDRVQVAGVGNASADDLAAALRDPLTPSRTYDEIRAEQRRRGLV